MLGDHFTKPLQGALFRKFRTEIMNIPDDLDMGEMVKDGKGLNKGITCKVLPGGARVWDIRKYTVSRQHERDVIGKEKEEI